MHAVAIAIMTGETLIFLLNTIYQSGLYRLHPPYISNEDEIGIPWDYKGSFRADVDIRFIEGREIGVPVWLDIVA